MNLKPASDGKMPITTHPAFPAIVALWCAALLGLGSMVVPVTALERLIGLTGLPAIVPAAQAPLGVTARSLIAVAAAAGGAIAGLLLARRLAALRSHTGNARIAAATPRPISALEELGEEGLSPASPRRRNFAPPAPAADDMPEEIALERFEAEGEAEDLPDSAPDDTPADPPIRSVSRDAHLFGLFQELEELAAAKSHAEVADAPAQPAFTPEYSDHEGPAMIDMPDVTPATTPFAGFAQDIGGSDAMTAAADARSEDDAVPLPQLLDRLARSLDRRRQAATQASATAEPEPYPLPVEDEIPPPPPARMADLSPPVTMEPARPEEAAQAMAAYFGKPAAISPLRSQSSAMPAAFRADLTGADHDWEMNEDDGLTASLSLPRAILPDSVVEEEDDGEDYPSLLSLGHHGHARQMFIPVEETADIPGPERPAAPVPGTASTFAEGGPARPFDRPQAIHPLQGQAGAETDEALRGMLSRLQRMNGAS